MVSTYGLSKIQLQVQTMVDAIRNEDIVKARQLLAAGNFPVNEKDSLGYTLLTYSTYIRYGGGLEFTRLLLDHGADPNQRDSHGTFPIMRAASVGDKATVALLLERGADVTVRDDCGCTVMKYATESRSYGDRDGVIRLLEEAEIKKGLVTREQIEAKKAAAAQAQLNKAFAGMSLDQFKAAVQAGADPTKIGADGSSVLYYLLDSISPDGIKDRLEVVVKAGFSLNKQDKDGKTILMDAIERGRLQAATNIMAMGVDLTLKDAQGKTAYDYVVQYGTTELAEKMKASQVQSEIAARDAKIAELQATIAELTKSKAAEKLPAPTNANAAPDVKTPKTGP